MNKHSLNKIFVAGVFTAALTATGFAQENSKEKGLKLKEAELRKKEDDLDRQRRELEDARKQLQLEETGQNVTIRLEGDVLFDSVELVVEYSNAGRPMLGGLKVGCLPATPHDLLERGRVFAGAEPVEQFGVGEVGQQLGRGGLAEPADDRGRRRCGHGHSAGGVENFPYSVTPPGRRHGVFLGSAVDTRRKDTQR